MGDAVEQCDVRARLHRQMQVGHHGRLGDARVGHDERAAGSLAEAAAQDRMVVRDVRADQQHHVGRGHIVVAARRPVRSEGELVAGDGGRHAEGCIAVVVRRPKPELHQLAERVVLLGEQLAGAHNTERSGPETPLNTGDSFHHRVQRLIPGDGLELAVLPQQRRLRAAGRAERVVLGQALGAQLAAVHRMVGVAARGHGFAVLDADQHAAADRAVAARRLHPRVRKARLRDVAKARVFGIGVVPGRGVEAEPALELGQEAHAWRLRRALCTASRRTKVRAILSGTTVTKNR